MCKAKAALSAAVAVTVFASLARAQQQDTPAPAPRHYKAQPLNLQKDQLGVQAYASAARSRMNSGDCAGALDSFDAALRTTSSDPTLFRDRGLCHEKLGHPYPAIDDYRQYLTDLPEAVDAPAIRKKLVNLEDETTGRAPSAASSDDTDVPPVDTSVSGTTSAGEGHATTPVGPPHDKMDFVDPDDDALSAPLRRGKGMTLGPIFGEKKWFFSGSSFGDSQTWSESIGVQLRYSFGPPGALVVEGAYERFNSTNADAFIVSGFTTLLAYEFRFALDPTWDNQLLFDPGIGYDHLGFDPTNPAFQPASANAVIPRVRLGYRHLIGDSAAIDLSLDFGVSKWFVGSGEGSPSLETTAMVALNVGVVWGL
jgi:hypothetical protein